MSERKVSKAQMEVREAVAAERKRIVRFLRKYAKDCRGVCLPYYNWSATALEKAADAIVRDEGRRKRRALVEAARGRK